MNWRWRGFSGAGYNTSMKPQSTQSRLANLIQVDKDAGKQVQWLEIDHGDRASLIAEIRKESGPLAKAMKKSFQLRSEALLVCIDIQILGTTHRR